MTLRLDAETFEWAVGIEDTFIPQPLGRTGRALDEYELTQHYRLWREDLDLAASLGVRTLRYGIPWHRVEPSPGRFEWGWTDQVLEYMTRDLGLRPIVDLMHYGCPLWLEREFASPEYPERVAAYAREFAERYKGLVSAYTPLNEPLVNARFCGYTGQWPPGLRGWRGWTRLVLALAEGMQVSVRAIREAQPEATIVHVEATSHYTAADPSLEDAMRFRQERQSLPTDLLLGRVDEGHGLRPWLLDQGAPPDALERLRQGAQGVDVLGCNWYPYISNWRLEAENGPGRLRRVQGSGADLAAVVRAWHERYGRPVMVTETSLAGSVRRRERWMDESIEATLALRAAGVPVIGYTWWPMFSLVAWSYRAGRKPLSEYLVHMGLWDLRAEPDGTLRRERTPLVERYAAHVARGAPTA